LTPVYHITHLSNLPGILAEGGLWCDAESERRGLAAQSVAHAHIKQRRKVKVVTCGAGGVLADYVPFYFAPRSPMLYSIHNGYVQGYDGGQQQVLHLVSSVEAIRDAGLDFVFTDGHAVVALTKFFAAVEDLDKVDWTVMPLVYWNDTQADPDRKRRRQAEFLVREFVPLECFTEIGVCTGTTAVAAHAHLAGHDDVPMVNVRPAWYY
jgi:hypothetical protein